MPKSFATDTLANQAVRDIVDDARTLYRLPEVMTEQLDAEAASLGKTRRDYVAHVLSLRAAQLLKGEISLPGKGSRPPKR